MSGFQLHLPLILILLATAVGVLTTLYGLYYLKKYGGTKQATTFTVLAATITVWAFFAMLQLTATDFALSYWAYKMLHFGSFTTAPAVLFYALSEPVRKTSPITLPEPVSS
ncbi:histidine kinase N-terminal 7TM domain-containing protein [Halanaeroarchaeum sulfurireducens]|uniref:PAS domain S-box n=1 Tax=Halanaeroarchaeum sulfurireducens TaxID=1604004 RepID=A0A0F7PDR4_9EURY|nr:histidine kinase N-terminal 7TM domain-containing protein [Halanaeroarchaeum sulfurireducens]AKH97478.1 PAS domain S-box [Halanaeroarchaeum sulfurireducens]ALG81874.1 PAS domain S-box [Halanaeroarchaeum sulfurireducens]